MNINVINNPGATDSVDPSIAANAVQWATGGVWVPQYLQLPIIAKFNFKLHGLHYDGAVRQLSDCIRGDLICVEVYNSPLKLNEKDIIAAVERGEYASKFHWPAPRGLWRRAMRATIDALENHPFADIRDAARARKKAQATLAEIGELGL